MTNPEESNLQSRRRELEKKMFLLDERLRHELLARGFDPAQYDNLALTAPLAKLYMERESLREQLESRDSEGLVND